MDDEPQTRPLVMFAIALCAVAMGTCIGGVTSAINGAVSPRYFSFVMNWPSTGIWQAAIAQGLLEGTAYGLIFSLVFTLTLLLSTRGRTSFAFALAHLRDACVITLTCWCLGGGLAMGMATLSPTMFRSHFRGLPYDMRPMLGYAWVGGSIWGAIAGGVLSLIIINILIATRGSRAASRGFQVLTAGAA